MKKNILIIITAITMFACNTQTDNRTWTEKTTATIEWHNTTDYYAIVYFDSYERITLLPDMAKIDNYVPDNFSIDIKVTLHKIDGSKYVIEPLKEFIFSQKFHTDMNYKYTISNNNVHAQTSPEL